MNGPTKGPEHTRRRRMSDVSLDFKCAYCGRSKNERPPEWCVRRHEGYDASLQEIKR